MRHPLQPRQQQQGYYVPQPVQAPRRSNTGRNALFIVGLSLVGAMWIWTCVGAVLKAVSSPSPAKPDMVVVKLGTQVTPEEIYRDFRKDEKAAQVKYGGKTLCIHGTVSEHGRVPREDGAVWAPCFLVQNLVGPDNVVTETGVKLTLCFADGIGPEWPAGQEFYATCEVPANDTNGKYMLDEVILHGCSSSELYCPREPSPFTDRNVTVRNGRVVPRPAGGRRAK